MKWRDMFTAPSTDLLALKQSVRVQESVSGGFKVEQLKVLKGFYCHRV